MRNKIKSVSIRKLPEKIDGAQRKALYADIESCINVDRPAVVLDCSMLNVLDRSAVHFLLCCLEEAMKRNGDVKLAALRTELRGDHSSTLLESLFQIYETVGDAVESYHRPVLSLLSHKQPAVGDQPAEMTAA